MACQLLPTDVHDTATKIGQEFQRLIEEYGASSVSAMVPAVVSALEQLESYVEEYQRLQTKNFKLRLEKDSLLAERERREKLEEEKRVSLADVVVASTTDDESCARAYHKRHTSPALRSDGTTLASGCPAYALTSLATRG